MHKITLAMLVLAVGATAFAAPDPGPPAIDKTKLEQYLRYAEGFTSGVKITIGDLGKTASPELWAIPVHLTLGGSSVDRTYYVTADGQEITGGKVWYLGESPFEDIIKQLPTNGPYFGPSDAPVTMVVFSDFECPFCRQLAQTIRQQIPKNYPTQVKVVFVDFPLQKIHPWAYAMAEAARCVWDGNNDRFWALHDWVFEHQQEITKDNVKDKVLAYAKEHDLDASRIAACIESGVSKPAIEQNLALAKKLDLDQTPVLFVNGRMLGGAQKWDTLDAVIKLDLERNQELSGTTAGKNH